MGGRGTALRSFPSCDWRREALRRPLRPRALRAARATAAIAHWRPGCPFRRLRHACTPQLGGAEAPPAQPLDRGKRAPSSCVCPARSAACWKRGRAGQLAPQRLSRCARVEPAAPPKAARPLLARGGRIAGVGRSPPPLFLESARVGRAWPTRARHAFTQRRDSTPKLTPPPLSHSPARRPPPAAARTHPPPPHKNNQKQQKNVGPAVQLPRGRVLELRRQGRRRHGRPERPVVPRRRADGQRLCAHVRRVPDERLHDLDAPGGGALLDAFRVFWQQQAAAPFTAHASDFMWAPSNNAGASSRSVFWTSVPLNAGRARAQGVLMRAQ